MRLAANWNEVISGVPWRPSAGRLSWGGTLHWQVLGGENLTQWL